MKLSENLLNKIKPFMESVTSDIGEISSGNVKYINRVIYKDADKTLADIRIASSKMVSLEK